MRNLSVDILKIVMAFFVVFLHMHLLRDDNPTISYVLVNGLFRLGVPIFLLISGYYFFYINDFKKLKKWLFRLFILYSIWTIIYMPLWKNDDSVFINTFFGYHHLWYLIGTLFGGLILYFLKDKSSKLLMILASSLFLLGYSIQYLANSHYLVGDIDKTINQFFIYRNFLMVCFPFLTLGFVIKREAWEKKIKPHFLWVIIGCGVVIAEAYGNLKILHLKERESVDLLISLLLVCPLILIYCKNYIIDTKSKILANISTAIYCIHPWLMEWLLEEQDFKSLVIFFTTLIIASILLVFLNKKLKYLL